MDASPRRRNTRIAVLRRATLDLLDAGIPGAETDARILLCAAACIDRAALLRDPDVEIDRHALRRLDGFLSRRKAREPVSRILGRREFWGISLAVTPAVLDPRPDTETLVASALTATARGDSSRILDLGTGSGAILCAMLSERQQARGVAVDISADACAVARDNLDRAGVGARALVVRGRWGEALAPRRFDIVVSNPPYIATETIASLDRDVREFDPRLALDGGTDGLSAYRAILLGLPGLLAPDGVGLFEVGAGQAEAVVRLARERGLSCRGVRRDLAGTERVVLLGQD